VPFDVLSTRAAFRWNQTVRATLGDDNDAVNETRNGLPDATIASNISFWDDAQFALNESLHVSLTRPGSSLRLIEAREALAGIPGRSIHNLGITMWKHARRLAVALGIASLAAHTFAQGTGSSVPAGMTDRPIELVVPWGTGGGSDQMARALARAMEKQQPGLKVAVINKPGGNGTLGLTHALGQPADGHTLALITNDFLLNHLAGTSSIKPEDFDYVGRVVADVEMLFARPDDKRLSSFDAYVKEAKAKPGTLTIATAGANGVEQLSMTLVNKALGIDVKWVPFDKPGERLAAFLGGHVDLMVEEPSDMKQHIGEGKMKPLLQLTEKRTAAFPDAPTARERGADVTLGLWRGIAVRKGTSPAVLGFLEKAMARAVTDDEFVKDYVRQRSLDIRPGYLSAADFRQSVAEEHRSMERILKGQ
jgi:tripartite-type tricarboxylate transporter receptor subunit TctC